MRCGHPIFPRHTRNSIGLPLIHQVTLGNAQSIDSPQQKEIDDVRGGMYIFVQLAACGAPDLGYA